MNRAIPTIEPKRAGESSLTFMTKLIPFPIPRIPGYRAFERQLLDRGRRGARDSLS
jgi:hypothetical protein